VVLSVFKCSFSWFYVFKCSFSWFFLSSNAVSRASISLQIQFFMLIYFQMRFLMVVSVFKCSSKCWYLFWKLVFYSGVCLQMQFQKLVSLFKFSFLFWYLSSNAVFHAGVCIQMQIFFLLSLLTCSFSCWCLPWQKTTNITSSILPKSPTDNCHVTHNTLLFILIFTSGHFFCLLYSLNVSVLSEVGHLRAETCSNVKMRIAGVDMY
jgi:hypothetical protein